MITEERKEWLLHRYRLPWETMSTIIGGTSSIDMDRLFITTEDSAERFLTNYGYKFSSPAERFELKKLYSRALVFIKEMFLVSEPELRMPVYFEELEDLRELLLMVSGEDCPERTWACAILRVMHTMAHTENSLNEEYFPQIRRQIIDRFQKHIFVDTNGKLYLGEGAERIPLIRWEVKEEKPFGSIVLKLLHKPENVAEDIFDRVGFRIVTETKMDTLLAIKYLRSHHIIMFANIKPTRSRNTLLNLGVVKKEADELFAELKVGALDEETFIERFHGIEGSLSADELERRRANPFSSEAYKSIQFTCRQLIRISNPLIPHVKQMEEIISGLPTTNEQNQLKGLITNLPIQETSRFFFPFEIQLMDDESYLDNMKGRASYDEYKANQLLAAKRRVLGSLVRIGDGGKGTE